MFRLAGDDEGVEVEEFTGAVREGVEVSGGDGLPEFEGAGFLDGGGPAFGGGEFGAGEGQGGRAC